jgi:ribose 5-phosphate isomerase A
LTGGGRTSLAASNFYLVTLEVLKLEAATQPMSVGSTSGSGSAGQSAACLTNNRIGVTPPAGTTNMTLRAESRAAIRRPWVRKLTRAGGHARRAERSLSTAVLIEDEKRIAAETAAEFVRDGDLVGLGTGSTVAYLLPALAARGLNIRCVATSPATAQKATALGIDIVAFEKIERLDIAIDGADQITEDGWLVKGGGGAHTREKIVAGAAARFVVVASSNKLVGALEPPIPLELLRFGVEATLASLGMAELRDVPPSPDGGLIADYRGPIGEPAALAAWLSATPGVVAHGLFAPSPNTELVVARGEAVLDWTVGGRPPAAAP